MRKAKKFLAMFLAIVMIVSALPVTALAAETQWIATSDKIQENGEPLPEPTSGYEWKQGSAAFTKTGTLICNQHAHGDECYETKTHEHSDAEGCYTLHAHDGGCYTNTCDHSGGTCGYVEAHEHDFWVCGWEGGFGGNYACGQEETNGSPCTAAPALTCDKAGQAELTCQTPASQNVLNCGIDSNHTHRTSGQNSCYSGSTTYYYWTQEIINLSGKEYIQVYVNGDLIDTYSGSGHTWLVHGSFNWSVSIANNKVSYTISPAGGSSGTTRSKDVPITGLGDYTVEEFSQSGTVENETYGNEGDPVYIVTANGGTEYDNIKIYLTIKLTETGTTVLPATVSLAAAKNLTGRALEAGEFTFSLTGTDGTSQTKTNAAGGAIAFDAITYDEDDVGQTYTYTISENTGSLEGVTYDTSTETVTVVVTKEEKGTGFDQVVATVTYDGGDSDPGAAVFNNTYGTPAPEVETTDITVTKVWTGEDDTGVRPDAITVMLQRNGADWETRTISGGADADEWTATFSGLVTKDAEGSEYAYTVKEVTTNLPTGYTSTVSGFTITNTYDAPDVITGIDKEIYKGDWTVGSAIPADDQWGYTRDKIVLTAEKSSVTLLYKITVKGDADASLANVQDQMFKDGVSFPVTAHPDNPKVIDADGETELYYYATITETGSYKNTAVESTLPDEPEVPVTVDKTIDITVKKSWSDGDNADRVRPASVTVELYANGVATGKTVTLSESNNWTDNKTFTGLEDKTVDAETGEEKDIVYSVVEKALDESLKYEATYSSVSNSNGTAITFTVTNTRTTLTQYNVSVRKTWTYPEGAPVPASLQLQLLNGEKQPVSGAVTITPVNGVWSYNWGLLPRGSYSVEEVAITDAEGNDISDLYIMDGEPSVSLNGATGDYVISVANKYDGSATGAALVINKTFTGLSGTEDLSGIVFTLTQYPSTYTGEKTFTIDDFTPGEGGTYTLTINGAPIGTYTVEESGTSLSGKNLLATSTTSGSATLASDGTAAINLVNNYEAKTGSLIIEKVTNSISSENNSIGTPTTAKFYVVPAGSTDISTAVVEPVSFGTGFTDADGDGTYTATVTGIPEGTYTVIEDGASQSGWNWNVSYSGAVSVTEGAQPNTIRVTNTYTQRLNGAYVRLVKKIEGDLSGKQLEDLASMTFTLKTDMAQPAGSEVYVVSNVYVPFAPVSITYGGMTKAENVLTEAEYDFEKIQVDRFSGDQVWKVMESGAAVEGYDLEVEWSIVETLTGAPVDSGSSKNPTTVSAILDGFASGKDYTVTFTNTYTEQKGKLTLQKSFVGIPEGAIPADLTFVVTGPFNGVGTTDVEREVPYSHFVDGEYTFPYELPYGVYTVTEKNTDSTDYVWKGAAFKVGSQDYTSNNTIKVTGGKHPVLGVENTYERTTGLLTINKTITGFDADDVAAIPNITFTLKDDLGKETTLSLSDFTKQGNSFVYQWSEQVLWGEYTITENNYVPSADTGYHFKDSTGTAATVTVTAGGTDSSFDITNNYYYDPARGTSVIEGEKIWEDNGNADGLRPESIRVALYLDGQPAYNYGETVPVTVDVTGGKFTISHTFDKVVYGATIAANRYSIEEIGYTDADGYHNGIVPGYDVSYEGSVITNSYEAAVTTLKIQKLWEGSVTRRPITVDIYANGQRTQSVTLQVSDNWYAEVVLPKNSNGQPINYVVREATSLGTNWSVRYSTPVSSADGSEWSFTLTNVYDDDPSPTDPDDGGGGGGGGGPTPTPTPEPVVINETPVPLAEVPELPEDVEYIPDEEVPLTDLPDEEVPLAELPQTGIMTNNVHPAAILGLFAASLSMLGAAMGLKKKDEEI